jgi:hypothetical protein
MHKSLERENYIFGILEASRIEPASTPENIEKSAIDIMLKSSYQFCNVVVFDFDTDHKVVQVQEIDDNHRRSYIVIDEIAAIRGGYED